MTPGNGEADVAGGVDAGRRDEADPASRVADVASGVDAGRRDEADPAGRVADVASGVDAGRRDEADPAGRVADVAGGVDAGRRDEADPASREGDVASGVDAGRRDEADPASRVALVTGVDAGRRDEADPASRVALVTGAARFRGIGRAIALRLAEDGMAVVVHGSRRPPGRFPDHERERGWRGAASVAEEIKAAGGRSSSVEADVADPDDVAAMLVAVEDRFGRLDVLVNNAALPSEAGAAPVLDMDADVWLRTVDVNLNGLYWVTRHAGRLIRSGGRGGAIVNISSMAGRQGLPSYGAYCATKWAMIGLTQQLAVELAGDGIRVNCVCPGSTDTDMMDGTFARTAARYGLDDEAPRAGAVARIPMRRQGRPPEQAEAVAFLASDVASYITGQTLNVDGGLRMD